MVQLHARVVELPRDGPSSILFVDPKPLISRGLRSSGGDNQLHTFASAAAVNSPRGRKHPAFEAWGLCRWRGFTEADGARSPKVGIQKSWRSDSSLDAIPSVCQRTIRQLAKPESGSGISNTYELHVLRVSLIMGTWSVLKDALF